MEPELKLLMLFMELLRKQKTIPGSRVQGKIIDVSIL